MQLGLFCSYDNPRRDTRTAYAEQTALIELVEGLGFGEAWVTEHHFNPETPSPSSLALLAYLAARTERIRLGSAAVLLPFHSPIHVAEDVATVDQLSAGRFNFGVAKGGPFPQQNKHFGVTPETGRAMTVEALTLIERLLREDEVFFEGQFYKTNGVSVTPKPLQSPLPIFIATSTRDMVKVAAERGHGFMCGPPYPVEFVKELLTLYQAEAQLPTQQPRFVLARFLHLAPTREQAEEEARVLLAPFIEKMSRNSATMQPAWVPWFETERLIAESLVGTVESVVERVVSLGTELNLHSLLFKPLNPTFEKQRADLEAIGKVARDRGLIHG